MTKRVNAKKNKWLLISILSLLCLLMSAVFMCVSFCDERKSQAYNKSVVEDAIVVEKEQPKTKDTIPITVDFIKLKKRNKDIIAWLYCEDTQINYPVVQSADNEYYLRRLIDGTWAVAGTLFFDYRNSSDVSDWYTVIYGHNMHNDTMFGSLHKFSDADYLKKHPNMFLFTQSSIFKIELVSGYVTKTDSDIYNVDRSMKTRNSIFNEAITKTSYKKRQLQDDDKLLVLSTCSNEFDNARFVLVGKIKKAN